jgi:hypothetical protein
MNEDDLYRSAVAKATSSQSNVAILAAQSENDLFATLAQRTEAVALGVQSALAFDAPFSADDLRRDSATIALGRRIFRRWSRALHQFACSTGEEDKSARDRLWSALIGKEGGAAVIAGILVASFGASAAVAAVVAALLVKIVIQPATEELCESWGRSL